MPMTTKLKDPTKSRASKPRERLSLPLTPHMTKSVQAIAAAFRRGQSDVLADLLTRAEPVLRAQLDALRGDYEVAQREALVAVLEAGEQPAGDSDAPGLYGEHAP